jgi:hypothetical protein
MKAIAATQKIKQKRREKADRYVQRIVSSVEIVENSSSFSYHVACQAPGFRRRRGRVASEQKLHTKGWKRTLLDSNTSLPSDQIAQKHSSIPQGNFTLPLQLFSACSVISSTHTIIAKPFPALDFATNPKHHDRIPPPHRAWKPHHSPPRQRFLFFRSSWARIKAQGVVASHVWETRRRELLD